MGGVLPVLRPPSQSPAAGFSKSEAGRDPRVCALVLRGRLGPKSPAGNKGLVRIPQDLSIYSPRGGRGGGKDREGAAVVEEGGKLELEVPWK